MPNDILTFPKCCFLRSLTGFFPLFFNLRSFQEQPPKQAYTQLTILYQLKLLRQQITSTFKISAELLLYQLFPPREKKGAERKKSHQSLIPFLLASGHPGRASQHTQAGPYTALGAPSQHLELSLRVVLAQPQSELKEISPSNCSKPKTTANRVKARRKRFKIQTQPKASLVMSFKTKNSVYQPTFQQFYYQVN